MPTIFQRLISNGFFLFVVFGLTSFGTGLRPAAADGPADNNPDKVRRVPRLGIELKAADQAALRDGLKSLDAQILRIRQSEDARRIALLPDVQIFHRAVEVALRHREFFAPADVQQAKQLLQAGRMRAEQLARGEAPWTQQTGLVVRGFVSRIDRSIQPYGLVVPASYVVRGAHRHRLDLWFHGRGETLSEVKFLAQRMRQVGQFAPADTFVLHPYGRYSNAFKFAGEVDVLEALAHARQHYRIDSDRISVRGFSMGGAACWQFAVHYADRWFAANPGAGFSETPEFLKFFQKETLTPTWYEEKLWRWYDCNHYATNLVHCPTVAYSGENDIQKQAADIMEGALAKQNIALVHIIGPKTGHRIHPDSKRIIERRMDSLAHFGRRTVPDRVRLVTYTLKYNRMHWLTIDALDAHWERAHVDAQISGNMIRIKTSNVRALTLSMPPGAAPFDPARKISLVVDSQRRPILVDSARSDRSWHCRIHKNHDAAKAGGSPTWTVGHQTNKDRLVKRHGLQGPIDDAFMDSFVIVRPDGKARHKTVNAWTRSEMQHAIEHWRRQFRGDAIVKDPADITDQDIQGSHLVLFGDTQSNSLLAKIAGKLPLQWSAETINAGSDSYDASHHALICVYPNPLNPQRYVVLNSGFTYREYDYLNNARQVAKLPDWAIVDLRTPPNSRYPGKIVNANFFDESWRLK